MRARSMLAAAALSVLLAGPVAAQDRVPPPLATLFGGPFELVDQDGAPRTDADYRGRFMLIYFGYTFCPDICPTNLAVMSEALDALGPDATRIQPILISVDPARDTPEALKDYVAAFHPSLVGLGGSEAQVQAAAKAYRVHRRKVIPPDTNPDAYLVDHSSLTYLMGPDGRFVTMFPHDTPADRMADVLRGYLARVPAG